VISVTRKILTRRTSQDIQRVVIGGIRKALMHSISRLFAPGVPSCSLAIVWMKWAASLV
jgi:hypothetical protein